MEGLEAVAGERFAVGRRLGEGGFGVVCEAWDAKLERPVAIKFLRRLENRALLRFKREFRSLADVRHPNLVRLGELVAAGGSWFFTMELVDGRDLLSHVARDDGEAALQPPAGLTVGDESLTIDTPASGSGAGWSGGSGALPGPRTLSLRTCRRPFDEGRLREAFAQLAGAVAALHGHGLLHRDLKPSNVLVERDGRLVVLDFGLVAHLGEDEAAASLHIVGTPAYMAPEQSLGREVTPASDWYSVGVMLHEALTGWPLFSGGLGQIILERQTSAVRRPSELVPGVPPDLDELAVGLLQLEPGDRPDAPEVLRRLAGERRVGVAVPPLAAPGERLVGRRRQLAQLAEALDRVRAGRAATVAVSGASGMGKTALVRCFLERLRATERGAVVLSARCYQRESVPYKAIDGLVDELARHLERMPTVEAARFMPRDRQALARLFPVLGGIGEIGAARRREPEVLDELELRRRAFAALRELLARLADSSLVVLFIDDLQWGDSDSATLLRELSRPPDPPPVLLLVCYRREDAARSPLLRHLADAGADEGSRWEIEVAELEEAEAVELALAALGEDGAAARERAAQIAREAGGSPFFVDELARHQAAAGDRGAGRLRLDSVLEARLAVLPAPARRLLEVVAVAGEPLDLEVANQAAELAAVERGAVEALQAANWVRPCALEAREAFEAFHDRIRETVLAMLPAAERLDRHGRLAAAWEAAGGASAATLVEHYLAAGERVRAAGHARRAADEAAASLAFDRAARLYGICLDAGDWTPAERGELEAARAKALANAGRGGEAARAYLAAAAAAAPALELELRRRAAEQFLVSGHIDEGREAMQGVLGMVGLRLPASPRRSLAGLLARRLQIAVRGLRFAARPAAAVPRALLARIDVCWSVAIGFGMVENIRGAHFQALDLLLALEAGEPFRAARALALELAFSAAGGGRSRRRTARLMARCRTLVREQDDPYLNGLFALQEGAVASLEGRYAESREACARAEAILREQCTGVTWELDTAQLYHNHALTMMGSWAALAARVPAMLEDAHEREDLYLATYLRTRNAYILHLAADELERARSEQARSLEGWSQRGFQVQHYWNWFASGEIDLYGAEPAAAWKRLERGWPDFRRSLLNRAQAVWVEALFLRARVALALAAEGGNGAEAHLRRAEQDARRLAREPVALGRTAAALLRAGVAAHRGELAAAAEGLRRADRAFAGCDMPHLAAAARWRLGGLLGGVEGAALLDGARSWFDEQGVREPERMVRMLAPGRWIS